MARAKRKAKRDPLPRGRIPAHGVTLSRKVILAVCLDVERGWSLDLAAARQGVPPGTWSQWCRRGALDDAMGKDSLGATLVRCLAQAIARSLQDLYEKRRTAANDFGSLDRLLKEREGELRRIAPLEVAEEGGISRADLEHEVAAIAARRGADGRAGGSE